MDELDGRYCCIQSRPLYEGSSIFLPLKGKKSRVRSYIFDNIYQKHKFNGPCFLLLSHWYPTNHPNPCSKSYMFSKSKKSKKEARKLNSSRLLITP